MTQERSKYSKIPNLCQRDTGRQYRCLPSFQWVVTAAQKFKKLHRKWKKEETTKQESGGSVMTQKRAKERKLRRCCQQSKHSA